MKVSVIIPTYGVPQFLDKAISSVLNQTMGDLELIIVDDNNPETEARKRTEELVEKYVNADSRVKYLKHSKNMNGANARNTGIAEASGEYIAFLDSDDEYMLNRLEKCCAVMDSSVSKIGGVYTGCEFRKGGVVFNTIKDVPAGNFLVETLACTFMFCTGSNLFVRSSVVAELNGFDGTFLRHQDYEFLVRLFENYDLAAIQEVLVIKNNENFNLPNTEKTISIKEQYLAKFAPVIERLDKDKQRYIYQSQYILMAESGMRFKNYAVGKKYYKIAKQYGKLSFNTVKRRYGFYIKNLLGK